MSAARRFFYHSLGVFGFVAVTSMAAHAMGPKRLNPDGPEWQSQTIETLAWLRPLLNGKFEGKQWEMPYNNTVMSADTRARFQGGYPLKGSPFPRWERFFRYSMRAVSTACGSTSINLSSTGINAATTA